MVVGQTCTLLMERTSSPLPKPGRRRAVKSRETYPGWLPFPYLVDVGCGKTNKEIAAVLKISENTAKNYMTILIQKLNARNRLEVVIAAQAMR